LDIKVCDESLLILSIHRLIDSAIRIATELRLGPQLKSVGADMDPIKERQSRNAERTWLTTLVLERSLGTFTGMRPKRDLDCDWVQLNKWAESDIATPGDVQTVAYLNLRRLEVSVTVFEVVYFSS
jgi:hypothetical protein